jgi:hypothetical protein
VKRALLYAVGIGVGAAVGIAIAKRLGPPAFGDRPRHGQPVPGTSPSGSLQGRIGKFGEMIMRAVDEGRRVMKQTEEELARQVASPGDGSS